MVDPINVSAEVATLLFTELGKIGLWLQALGLVIVVWLIFAVVNLVINRKKLEIVSKMQSDLTRIERKINKLSKK